MSNMDNFVRKWNRSNGYIIVRGFWIDGRMFVIFARINFSILVDHLMRFNMEHIFIESLVSIIIR